MAYYTVYNSHSKLRQTLSSNYTRPVLILKNKQTYGSSFEISNTMAYIQTMA